MTLIYILSVLIIILLLCLMTRPVRKYHKEAFNHKYIAHRGLFDNLGSAPENSLAAFEKAIKNGYPIELDVQFSRDGEVVVFHDFTLKRMCGVDKKVCELTLSELKELRLKKSEQKIPSFKEVLNEVDGRVPLLIELKVPNVSYKLAEAVAALLDGYDGIYSIQSFNPAPLVWFRKNRPDIARGQLSGNIFKFEEHPSAVICFFITNLLTNIATLPDFVSYKYEDRDNIFFKACKAIYRPYTAVWTVKSFISAQICKKLFNSIIFDSYNPNKTDF